MASIVGKALRGFGKALSKRSGDGKRITRVPIAKRLTERRKDTEKLFKIRQDAGASPMKSTAKHVKSTSAANTKYDKAVTARDKKIKSHNRKVIGAGAATVAGAVGAMEVGKRKSPKFKKFIESSVTVKDGKLKLVPKKKKD